MMNDLRAFFNLVRVVDPERMARVRPDETDADTDCRVGWGPKHERCSACAGLRAIREGERQTQFELVERQIYLVTALPVRLGDRTVALETIGRVDDRALLGIHRFAEFADPAMPFNARLQQDGATGLYSKRYFDDRLLLTMKQAALENTDVAAAMLDVDGLEYLAKEHGQQTADEAVIAVGRLLSGHVSRRRGDLAARYGANTFTLLFCNIPSLQLRERLAEMMQRVATLRLAGCGNACLKNAMGVFLLSDNRMIDAPDVPQVLARRVEIARSAGLNRIAFRDR
jgi:two-component system, cell cycle response regulator